MLEDRLTLALRSGALEIPVDGIIIVLRAEPSGYLDDVPAERLRCVQTFRPVHDALAARGHHVATEADGPAALVVVNLTRSRAENLGNVARGLDLLPPGGTLAVTGAKSDGIDSLARLLGKLLPVDATFVKAHGRVLRISRPASLPPEAADWMRDAEPTQNDDGFLTRPGVFSPEHADPGSRRLAGMLDDGIAGRVADLGAGWGWLARTALDRCPAIAELDLYEAEALALELSRENVRDPRATFHWSDVTTLASRTGPYDAVIANPPFHHSRAAEPAIGARFIEAAGRILKPSGRFLMVANRHLPYEPILDRAFGRWGTLEESDGYKVLEAIRPNRR